MSKSDQKVALEILEDVVNNKLEPLWDYLPGRPLGWLDGIMTGILEELRWKVQNEEAIHEGLWLKFDRKRKDQER